MEIHKETHKGGNVTFLSGEWEDGEVVRKGYSNWKANTMLKMEYYPSKIEID